MSPRDPYLALLALLLPAATAGCGREEGVGCMSVPDDTTECPVPADVDPRDLSGNCGSRITKITGAGELLPDFGYASGYTTDTSAPEGVQCCYEVMETKATCVYGRPYVVEGEAVVAGERRHDGWIGRAEPAVDGLPEAARERLAAAWLEAALDEHAAVAAFARVTLELMALGAPPDLILATQAAGIEEVGHARLGFALASAYAGRPVAPTGFPLGGAVTVATRLEQLAVAATRESCVGETLTSLVVAAALPAVRDPAVRDALERILAEERGHAALAWRTVRWAIDAGGEPVRDAVAAVFAEVAAHGVPLPVRVADGPHAEHLVAHGIPDAATCGEALRRGLAEVVLPAARALLSARPGGERGHAATA